jgi:hypothetical protein
MLTLTRRALLAAAIGARAFGKDPHHLRRPDTVEDQAQWMDFIAKWNHYAAGLNVGVNDERLWAIAEKALLRLLI